MRWRTAGLFAAGVLLVLASGCDTIVRNYIAPKVEDLVEDQLQGDRPGDNPPGQGHGRGGSKDTTTAP